VNIDGGGFTDGDAIASQRKIHRGGQLPLVVFKIDDVLGTYEVQLRPVICQGVKIDQRVDAMN